MSHLLPFTSNGRQTSSLFSPKPLKVVNGESGDRRLVYAEDVVAGTIVTAADAVEARDDGFHFNNFNVKL